jgi:hypothetical protein
MTKDDCPLFGSHKFFIAKTYDVYEPVVTHKNLYEKVEYAVLGCNCSAVVKMRVKEG